MVTPACLVSCRSCRLHEEVEDNSAESAAVKAPPPGKSKAVKGKNKTCEKDVALEVRAINMNHDILKEIQTIFM